MLLAASCCQSLTPRRDTRLVAHRPSAAAQPNYRRKGQCLLTAIDAWSHGAQVLWPGKPVSHNVRLS